MNAAVDFYENPTPRGAVELALADAIARRAPPEYIEQLRAAAKRLEV